MYWYNKNINKINCIIQSADRSFSLSNNIKKGLKVSEYKNLSSENLEKKFFLL